MKMLLGAIAGGIVGFALGYLSKCVSGGCPFIGNPITGTIIGIAIGLMLTAKTD